MALKLESAAAMVANLKHGERGSEDAFFVHGSTAGVADGVGSYYAKYGVDAGIFARQLMQKCVEQLDKDGKRDLLEIMSSAVASCTADGAATLVLASLKQESSLEVANVGDTACIVIRGDRVVAKTTAGRVGRTPHQVSKYEPFELVSVELLEVPLLCGDIIVLASDGLWDNLSLEQVVQVCRATFEYGVEVVAKVLLHMARYSGITQDDVTVVVLLAVRETGEQGSVGDAAAGGSSCWVEICLRDEKRAGKILWNAFVERQLDREDSCICQLGC